MVAMLPAIRAGVANDLSNAAPGVQALEVAKQLSGSNNGVYPANFPSPSALHASVGVQCQIARDFVASADFAYRHFVHTAREGLVALDLNHYNGSGAPVIPECIGNQAKDLRAICSLGPINVTEAPGARPTRACCYGLRSASRTGFRRWVRTPIQAIPEPAFGTDSILTTGFKTPVRPIFTIRKSRTCLAWRRYLLHHRLERPSGNNAGARSRTVPFAISAHNFSKASPRD